MRVTKRIESYITEEVRNRLIPKYNAEKIEAERQLSAKEEFLVGAAKAAEKAWTAYFEEHFNEISDFCEDNRFGKYSGVNYNDFYLGSAVFIEDRGELSSVHSWAKRCYKEAEEIISGIIVNLELGGTKAELEAMLNEIG